MAALLGMVVLGSCAPPLEAPPIELRLGTHEAGDVFGDTFMPLEAGAALPVVLGPQLSWMVVVGAELPALPSGDDPIECTCTVTAPDGSILGRVNVDRGSLSADGRYLLNVFVVVPAELSSGEWDARVELSVRAGAAEGRAALDVRLTGEQVDVATERRRR